MCMALKISLKYFWSDGCHLRWGVWARSVSFSGCQLQGASLPEGSRYWALRFTTRFVLRPCLPQNERTWDMEVGLSLGHVGLLWQTTLVWGTFYVPFHPPPNSHLLWPCQTFLRMYCRVRHVPLLLSFSLLSLRVGRPASKSYYPPSLSLVSLTGRFLINFFNMSLSLCLFLEGSN